MFGGFSEEMETNKNFTSAAASSTEARTPGLHFESLKCAILATNSEVRSELCRAKFPPRYYEVELRFEPRFAELEVHAPPLNLVFWSSLTKRPKKCLPLRYHT